MEELFTPRRKEQPPDDSLCSCPHSSDGRNLVVHIDGTGNQFGDRVRHMPHISIYDTNTENFTRIQTLSSYTTLQKNQTLSCVGITAGSEPMLSHHGRRSIITSRLFTTRLIWELPGEFHTTYKINHLLICSGSLKEP